jgi:hypothetical protein
MTSPSLGNFGEVLRELVLVEVEGRRLEDDRVHLAELELMRAVDPGTAQLHETVEGSAPHSLRP